MKEDFIWGTLIHLGTRMWSDLAADRVDRLRFDETHYRAVTERMGRIGVNMVVLDLGEGLVFPSHPELAVKDAWTTEKMRAEIVRLKGLGIEAIPKLNFSTTHHFWLGEYARMVSTPTYYRVCEEIIRDTVEIFGRPRFLHIGYDEEAIGEQPAKLVGCAVARQGELWWHDFLWFLEKVRSQGVRPWAWADVFWHWPEEQWARIPKDVLFSNWHYGRVFDENGPFEKAYEKPRLLAYRKIDRAGFDQIPCATNWLPNYYGTAVNDVNYPGTVRFCREAISSERLKGFLMAPWERIETAEQLKFWNAALDLVEAERKRW